MSNTPTPAPPQHGPFGRQESDPTAAKEIGTDLPQVNNYKHLQEDSYAEGFEDGQATPTDPITPDVPALTVTPQASHPIPDTTDLPGEAGVDIPNALHDPLKVQRHNYEKGYADGQGAEPPVTLAITDVQWDEGGGLTIIGSGFTPLQAADTQLTFHFDEFPPGDDLNWAPTNDFGMHLQSDSHAEIFFGSVQSFNGIGGNSRLNATLTSIALAGDTLWTGSVFTNDPLPVPTVGSFSSPEPDGITMSSGTHLDLVSRVRLFTASFPSGVYVDPLYTEQNANHIRIGTGYGMGLDGETVTKVELWTGTFPGSLAATYDGLSVLIESTPSVTVTNAFSPGPNQLVIEGTGLTDINYMQCRTGGSNQIGDAWTNVYPGQVDSDQNRGHKNYLGNPNALLFDHPYLSGTFIDNVNMNDFANTLGGGTVFNFPGVSIA